MAAKSKIAWGIDVGQYGLRAIKLEVAGEGLQVSDFAAIDYPKSLPSLPAASHDQTIRSALEDFTKSHSLKGSTVVVGVPGRNSQARFVALPPVEAKKIPQIVEFEARQQIPFDIDDVVWDYQAIRMEDSPDVIAGIFFVKHDVVDSFLANFQHAQILANQVQMSPIAMYNAMVYDGMAHPDGATVMLDVGSANTEFIVADGQKVFHRTIPIGGNNFTQALVKTFKLSFSKAENLKRKCSTSKYAKQVFQAMRSVFSDLSSEVQRSIGFYTTLNRQAKIKRVLAMGNTFRLSGLQKYLQQSLRIEFVRVDEFSRLRLGPQVRPPAFSSSILSLGVAYGLALQGLGRASIQANLLPPSIARQQVWRAKKPMFAAAVVLLAFIVAGSYGRYLMDRSAAEGLLKDSSRDAPVAIIGRGQGYKKDQAEAEGQVAATQEKEESYASLLTHRDVLPAMLRAVSRTLAVGDGREAEMSKPRAERRLVFLQKFSCMYSKDVDSDFAEKYGIEEPSETADVVAAPPAIETRNTRNARNRRNSRNSRDTRSTMVAQPVAPKPKKGFIMEVRAITPFQGDSEYNYVSAFLDEKVARALQEAAESELKALSTESEELSKLLAKFRVSDPLIHKMAVIEKAAVKSAGTIDATGRRTERDDTKEFADPTRPKESMAEDCYFLIPWKVYLGADAEEKEEPTAGAGVAPMLPAAGGRN